MRKPLLVIIACVMALVLASCDPNAITGKMAILAKGETFSEAMYLAAGERDNVIKEIVFEAGQIVDASIPDEHYVSVHLTPALAWLWFDETDGIMHVRTNGNGFCTGADCESMFDADYHYSGDSLEAVRFNGLLDTSAATSFRYAFYYCSKIQSLDLRNWDTSCVEDMYDMFYKCNCTLQLGKGFIVSEKTKSEGDIFESFWEDRSLEEPQVTVMTGVPEDTAQAFLQMLNEDAPRATETWQAVSDSIILKKTV